MTAHATQQVRLVYAPDGKAWVDGDKHSAGAWLPIEEARQDVDQQRVRYAEPDGYGSQVVAVPADELAAKADLMELAGDVSDLREELDRVMTHMQGASAVLNPRTPGIGDE